MRVVQAAVSRHHVSACAPASIPIGDPYVSLEIDLAILMFLSFGAVCLGQSAATRLHVIVKAKGSLIPMQP